MKQPEYDHEDPSFAAKSNGVSPQEARSESLAVLVWLAELARTVEYGDGDASGSLENPPTTIGPFRLDRLLGSGAYGAVFRAFDTDLERWVALKVAWPHVMFDAVGSRRFVEEPKAAASLDHPGILKVHRSGSAESIHYIALELIEGPTLGTWLKQQQQVSFRLAAQIVRQVAEAIHFAHQRGVIHRDIKPSNILLRPVGETAFPYQPVVGDFGLARRPRLVATSNLTGTHDVLGTDPYTSPEQLEGRSAEVGPASDVFSLGVILYELVARRRPFDGETGDDTRWRIKHDDPPAIRPWRNGVPKDLETIALKCLEKSSARRYRTAQDLAADLQRYLSGEPILGRRTGVMVRGWKYAKRKPLLVSLVALVVFGATLVAGLAGAWISDRISAADRIASAEAATGIAERIERQHQYASNIQHAAEALRHGRRRDVIVLLKECQSLMRDPQDCGIEWDWISSQVNGAERTIKAHAEGVCAVRFAPQGELLATVGKDGRVVLWETTNWTKRAELRYSDNAEAGTAEFSADGSFLAVGGDDGRVVVYRVNDASVVFDETIVQGRVFDVAWVGDSTQFAVGGDGTTLSVVDVLSHERRQSTLSVSAEGRALAMGHPDEISALVYVRSRNAIAVFLTPPTAYLIDPNSLEVITPSIAKHAAIGAVCDIAMETEYLAATGPIGIELWNASDGLKTASAPLSGSVQAMRYSKAAGAIGVAFRDGAMQICDVKSILQGLQPNGRRICAHADRAVSVDFSPDGTWMASGGWDGDLKVWRFASIYEPFERELPSGPLRMEFSRDGRFLAVACATPEGAGQVTVFGADIGKPLWSAPFEARPYERLQSQVAICALDPSGNELALVDGSSVQRFEASTGLIKSRYSLGSLAEVSGIAYTPDGQSLVVRLPYVAPIMLDAKTGVRIDNEIGDSGNSLGVFRTIHGDMWLEHKPSQSLLLRASSSMANAVTLTTPTEGINRAVVSQDGRYLAAGGRNGILYFWNLMQPNIVGKCVGHEARIGDLYFSPDSSTILSNGDDGTVRIWHVATRAELLRLGTPQRPIVSMALSPNGSLLVLAVRDEGRYGLQIHRLGPGRDALAEQIIAVPSNMP